MQNKFYGKIKVNPIPKHYDTDIDAETYIRAFRQNDLTSHIGISAQSFMDGRFDIVPPPLRTLRFIPIEDSSVRQFAGHMNYGRLTSLSIGKATEGELYSFLKFDIESIPKRDDIEIESAKLIFTKLKSFNNVHNIDLSATNNNWSERVITWNNKPISRENIISTAFEPNDIHEIDILPYFLDWYKQEEDFIRSFVVSSSSQNTSTEVLYYGSRESKTPSFLEITYWELPGSPGITRLDADVIVKVNEKDELQSSVEVLSNFVIRQLPADIELTTKINSTEIAADITVAYQEIEQLPADIELFNKQADSEIDAHIGIRYTSLIDGTIELYSKPDNTEIDASIEVVKLGTASIDASVELRRKNTVSKLEANILLIERERSSIINASVSLEEKRIVDDIFSNIELTIKESHSELEASVNITEISLLSADVELIKKEESSETIADMHIKPYEEITAVAEIIEKSEYDDLNCDIEVKVFGQDLLLSDVDIAKKISEDQIYADLFVYKETLGENQFEADIELTAKIEYSELTADVTMRRYSELDSDITFTPKHENSFIEADANLSNKEKYEDLESDVFPRIHWANMLDSVIMVLTNVRYIIERKNGDHGEWQVIANDLSQKTFEDEQNLIVGQTYHYRVKYTVNNRTESDWTYTSIVFRSHSNGSYAFIM